MFINIYTFAPQINHPALPGYHADQPIANYGSE